MGGSPAHAVTHNHLQMLQPPKWVHENKSKNQLNFAEEKKITSFESKTRGNKLEIRSCLTSQAALLLNPLF